MLIIFAVLAAGAVLTSFVINKKSTNNTEVGNEWQRWGTVTAWYKYDMTESGTLILFYKENENGTIRKYGYTTPDGSPYPSYGQIVERNSYYLCDCDNPTRDYRYDAGCYVFNADLPKFKN